jgi:hypothetical protein
MILKCIRCNLEKEINCIVGNSKRENGVEKYCKECRKIYLDKSAKRRNELRRSSYCPEERRKAFKKYYPDIIPKNKLDKDSKNKLCNVCNKWLNKDNFYKSKETTDELHTQCKACSSIRGSKYRNNNKHLCFIKDYLKRLKENNFINSSLNKKEVESILFTHEELKNHLNKFCNYNSKEYHIDHIIPCASFDLTKPEDQAKCFHYTNLQPLWASENLAKGSKISS